MYKDQLEILDNQKDEEIRLNEENSQRLKDFLQRELEKKTTLDKEVKDLEERTLKLNQTRNELFKQLNGMEKVIEEKQEELNDLRGKVLVKQTQLDDKQRELEDREQEVKALREKLRAVQQRQSAQKVIGAQDVLDSAKNYNNDE